MRPPFVVADGMGGHAVGDLASRITVDTLPHVYFKTEATDALDRMSRAVLAANKAVNDRGRENPDFADMGTTCSVLSLSSAGAIVGHIGDSRVYRVRQRRVCQLTFDHSLQWEMIRLGRATVENVDLYHPRNVITRCLGPDPNVAVDLEGPFSVHAGDRFVLCSDGLTNHVSDDEIGSIVTLLPPAEASRLLINLTNCRGGSDNTTVVVVEIDDYPELAETPVDHAAADAATRQRLSRAGIGRAATRYAGITLAGLLLVAAVALSMAAEWSWAAASATVGVLTGLAAMALGGRSSKHSVRETSDSGSEDDPPSGSTHYTSSPYRVVDVEPPRRLLNLLSEVQSELAQAARDSGWEVDFDELTHLSRQASHGLKNSKYDVAIRCRAKAIDLLMKELYHRARNANTA
jgi:protein phosphatase